MPVAVNHLNGVTVISISGKLDHSSEIVLPDYLKALQPEEKKKVLFDLSAVSHIDTYGIGQIIICANAIDDHDGKSCWVIPSEPKQILASIRRTGLDQMLESCVDVSSGIRRLNGE
jgi:anti-anti-sigma factor